MNVTHEAPRVIRQKRGAGWFWTFVRISDDGRKWLYTRNGRTVEINPDDIGHGSRYTPWED